MEGRALLAGETASAEAMRQDCSWSVQGTEGESVWLGKLTNKK